MGKSVQRGQSTLERVIGAAVILGTFATQRDFPFNHGATRLTDRKLSFRRRADEVRDELARYRPFGIHQYLEVAVPALDAR